MSTSVTVENPVLVKLRAMACDNAECGDAACATIRAAVEEIEEADNYLDDIRGLLLRAFPEMDRLHIAMIHSNAHAGEANVWALARHIATRLESARTPKEERPSEVVAARMAELRRERDRYRAALQEITTVAGFVTQGIARRALDAEPVLPELDPGAQATS